MKKLNLLFTLYSLTALVIIVERLLPSPLLQPFNFIRLHEINQTVIFLPIIVALSFFYLQTFTNNFQTLKNKRDSLLALCIFVGAYLYGAGEGWHEVASFTLNQYCNLKNLTDNLCHGLFINDYFAGNIIFFVGGVMMNLSLLTLASLYPMKGFNTKDMIILFSNSVVLAFTWFAYSAFDKVLVGLFFSALLMIVSIVFAQKAKWKFKEYPFIGYSVVAYSLATIGAALVKFL